MDLVKATDAALVIQRKWRISVFNPKFMACRNKLRFELTKNTSTLDSAGDVLSLWMFDLGGVSDNNLRGGTSLPTSFSFRVPSSVHRGDALPLQLLPCQDSRPTFSLLVLTPFTSSLESLFGFTFLQNTTLD
jgi:hypothetical protein